MVIDDNGEHIGWRAIRAQKHEIVEVLIWPSNPALHEIVQNGFAIERRLEPDDRLYPFRRFRGGPVSPAAVIAWRPSLGTGFFPHLLQFMRRRITIVSAARGEQAQSGLTVPRGALRLVNNLPIPIEAKPSKPVENGCDCRLRRALAVGVLDPQQHFAARMTGIEPIEERRAGTANMQKSGRRRGKTSDDLGWHGRCPSLQALYR